MKKNPYENVWDAELGQFILRKDQPAAHDKVRREDEARWVREEQIASEMERVNPSQRKGFTTGY